MSASFFPTLKHVILAKTAIEICNDPEVRSFVNELNYLYDKSSGEKRWKDLLDKASKKTAELNLPPQLHQSVMAVIKPIALEMARWKYDHLKVLGDQFDFLGCQLYWKPEGIIDRENTAQMLVRDGNVSKVTRFILACCYCLENEVIRIWNFLGPAEVGRVCDEWTYYIKSFWCDWMRRKGVIKWSTLAIEICNPLYQSSFCNYQKDHLWLRYFFDKLNPQEKRKCIEYTVNYTFKDHDNFRFCVSQVSKEEMELVFKENPIRLLRFFLDWPYQSLFTEATEQMWKYLEEEEFRNLLHFILYNRIVAEWYDFDYVNLLKEFWRRSPEHLKEYIKKDAIFEPVKMVIYHDFLKRFPKEEIMNSSSYVEPPRDKFLLLRDGDFFYSF